MICGKNYVCFQVPQVSFILNEMFALQSTPKKLLNQTKGTIFIIALKKIHTIGGNYKLVVWQAKDRFCIFGIIIKNYEDNGKRSLLKIVSVSLICPIMPYICLISH